MKKHIVILFVCIIIFATPLALAQSSSPTKPDPVTGITIQVQSSTSAIISWQKPNDGGSPITNYHLKLYEIEPAKQIQTIDGKSRAISIGTLNPGKSYQVIIQARNNIGISDESYSSVFTTPSTPDKPEKVTVLKSTIISTTSVRLDWEAPEDNGRAISYYDVKMEFINNPPLSTKTTQTALNTATFTNLLPNEKYRILITTYNNMGTKGASEFSITTSPAKAIPDPITIANVDVSASSLTVTWQPPNANNDPITNYRVIAARADDETDEQISNGLTTTRTFVGLKTNTEYKIYIEAFNGQGATSPYILSTKTLAGNVPDKITTVTIKVLDSDSIRLSWQAPNDGGSPILDYTASILDGNTKVKTYTGTIKTITFNGLVSEKIYTINISSRNIIGTSQIYSEHTSINKRPTLPVNPTITIDPIQIPHTATTPDVPVDIISGVIDILPTDPCFLNYTAGIDIWKNCGADKDFIQFTVSPFEWITGGFFSMIIITMLVLITYIKYHKIAYPLLIGTLYLPIGYYFFPTHFITFAILLGIIGCGVLIWIAFIQQTKEY